jgi:hypothetical protein
MVLIPPSRHHHEGMNKYNLWKQFPHFVPGNKKYLFDWCELNNPETNWTDYCYLKYPVTINFDDT